MHKFLNLFRIILSYCLSITFGRVIHWGKPVSVSLEPVNRCNLLCPECPTGNMTMTRDKGSMSQELFRKAIGQMVPELGYLTLYFQGEPYLHPGFLEMAGYAKSLNVYVASSTNGHFLDNQSARATVRSGLDRLIISLDGADQESYSAYRAGGQFETVLEGLRHLSDAKTRLASQKPFTVIQCLLLRTNQHQQGAIRKLAKEVRANKVEFKTAQFHDFENGNPLMPDERFSRYKKSTNQPSLSPKFVTKNPLRNACFRMWSSCVITWDGLVVPCCFDKDAGHVMGDLKVQSFDEIWHGDKYRKFRKAILQNRKSVDICQNCTQKY